MVLPLKTLALWSLLEAWAESGAQSLTSDKMLVVPLFYCLSYIIVGINIIFDHSHWGYHRLVLL